MIAFLVQVWTVCCQYDILWLQPFSFL